MSTQLKESTVKPSLCDLVRNYAVCVESTKTAMRFGNQDVIKECSSTENIAFQNLLIDAHLADGTKLKDLGATITELEQCLDNTIYRLSRYHVIGKMCQLLQVAFENVANDVDNEFEETHIRGAAKLIGEAYEVKPRAQHAYKGVTIYDKGKQVSVSLAPGNRHVITPDMVSRVTQAEKDELIDRVIELRKSARGLTNPLIPPGGLSSYTEMCQIDDNLLSSALKMINSL